MLFAPTRANIAVHYPVFTEHSYAIGNIFLKPFLYKIYIYVFCSGVSITNFGTKYPGKLACIFV